jgi:protein ImuA
MSVRPVEFPSAVTLAPLWRAHQLQTCAASESLTRPTGHPALDAELPGGGWPGAGLTELLLPAPGSGELRLLAPLLAHATLLWVAPPFTPYGPALAGLGLAPDRLVIAAPDDPADAAWAAEQALRSGALSAVLWWEPAGRRVALPPTTLRRLHLAAEAGRTPLFALRSRTARAQSSPAPLRLALEPLGPGTLAVDVFKRRGPPMAAPLVLTLPGPLRRRPRRAAPAAAAPAASHEQPHAVVRPAPERVAA